MDDPYPGRLIRHPDAAKARSAIALCAVNNQIADNRMQISLGVCCAIRASGNSKADQRIMQNIISSAAITGMVVNGREKLIISPMQINTMPCGERCHANYRLYGCAIIRY